MKLLIIGHARHGKDTAAEIIEKDFGMRHTSSSMFCAEKLMMPAFKHKARFYIPGTIPVYNTVQECFHDRVNHRTFWYDTIREYTSTDPSRLVREILVEHDIYVGLRSKVELAACRNSGLVDAIIWVDRSDVLPLESRNSNNLEPWMADYVIDNNGPLGQLHFNVRELMLHLQRIRHTNISRSPGL